MTAAIARVAFLYLRHGETDWNEAGRAQGRSDIPLNARGRAQAEAAARVLEGAPLDAIVASPLARAAETARIVAGLRGLPVTFADGLREVSFGEREGERMGDWYERWLAGDETPAGAESFAELTARAAGTLAELLVPGRRVLLVAHGALFRAIRAALGLPIHQRLANGVPLVCTPSDGKWTVEPVSPQQQHVIS